ncbi:dihydropteroate synthase [Flavimarina sp. Hel_I_48]|uniref:dihydropteroate synthase n=1 Tax=Flavimarina sp. Hel_I_48 TaxID=1392488 RepID=UPI0004DF9F60|nr:dihydropteroate synthase [Flavimarina sp. Hel_I_48]
MKSITCKGRLIPLQKPVVMGILNLTPDSFYDGGKYADNESIIDQTARMLSEGATFIDLGAYSSRPGADHVCEEEELERLLPIITLLLERFPDILLSIDTFRARVARQSIEAGAALINDISAGMLDDNMLKTVAELQVPYIMMHMRGTPQTMKSLTEYDNLVKDVLFYFSERVAEAQKQGINDLIIDPGFGFAKTINQNFELLSRMELFQALDFPLLAGLSRKSTIYKTLELEPSQALNGTTVLNTIALQKGATIVRVHDVKPAIEAVKLLENLAE